MIQNQKESWEADDINQIFKDKRIHFYLVSSSPRRKWILETWGLQFSTLNSEFDEDVFLQNLTSIKKQDFYWKAEESNHKELIHEICNNLAIQKALIAWEQIKEKNESFIITSADTIVYYNQYFLGKPRDREEAMKMLSFLSGKTHTVLTSHCLVTREKHILVKEIMTLVTFRKLSNYEIQKYLDIDEPYDKAGGYAIQGYGSIFIDSIVGDFLNVIGFSINGLKFLLKELTL